ncbi:MAG: T9SS type A sorting domain-containing protein [Ignavibacteriales bacterium]|nr:T9SS type A sorting domain-containing protein [Ignavibacteriales bacterium]
MNKLTKIFVFFIIFSKILLGQIIIEDSLVAYYPFNGNANDESGNFLHGTVYGSTLDKDRNNSDNSSFYFDGINNFISLPTDFDFPERTICLWFNFHDFTSDQGIIYTSDHPELNFSSSKMLIRDINNEAQLEYYVGGILNEIGSVIIDKNRWYFIALSVDQQNVKCYLNSELIKTFPFINHHSNSSNFETALLGTDRYANGRFFNGLIDDIRIYNKVLDQVDINSLYIETLVANFTAEPLIGTAPLTVNFTDISTNDLLNPIYSWQWDFDNDDIIDSEIQNPDWTYVEPGLYTVKLKVTDSQKASTKVKKNYITVYSEFPAITEIKDIPDDQGGWVKINFLKSIYDTDSLILPKIASPEFYTCEIYDGTDWLATTSTAAYGKSNYSLLVHTLKDSTLYTNGLLKFRVVASMNEGIFASKEITGYSIDNLSPNAPELWGDVDNSGYVNLEWQSVDDNDLKEYCIYKSLDGNSFNLIAKTSDNYYIDNNVTESNSYFYSLKSVDLSGNESVFSNIVSIFLTEAESTLQIPTKFSLSQNYPNPFNPSTSIKFSLPEESKIKIEVFNMLGQQVDILADEIKSVGFHEVIWNAENISSGLYMINMKATGIQSHNDFNGIIKSIFIK